MVNICLSANFVVSVSLSGNPAMSVSVYVSVRDTIYFTFFFGQCAQRSNARTANMEWSTKQTTMDVRSASANLTVSESLSANCMVSVCL